MRLSGGAKWVSSSVAGVKAAVGQTVRRAAWAVAGLPSGPIGWVSSRWLLVSPATYRALGAALQLRPDDDLLDVACGSGAFLAQEARQVRHVAGVDLSDVQIDLARRRLAQRIAVGTAEVVRGDAAALPWPDDSFTVVTGMAAFEVFPDPARVLAEVFRVLRHGGRAVLNIGQRVAPGTQTHRVLFGDMWVWSEDDARRLVEEAGFTDVSISYAPWWGSAFEKLFARLMGPELRLVHAFKK